MTKEEVKDYLYSIRHLRQAIKHLREQREAAELRLYPAGIDYSSVKVQSSYDDHLAAEMDVLDGMQAKEIQLTLELLKRLRTAFRMINQLDNSLHRQVLFCYFLMGMSMAETAKDMECSERAVYRYYSKALEEYSLLTAAADNPPLL